MIAQGGELELDLVTVGLATAKKCGNIAAPLIYFLNIRRFCFSFGVLNMLSRWPKENVGDHMYNKGRFNDLFIFDKSLQKQANKRLFTDPLLHTCVCKNNALQGCKSAKGFCSVHWTG